MRKGISKTSHKFTDWLPYLLACLSFPSIENIESHCSALFFWVLSEDSKLCISWNYVNCVPQNGPLLENHNVILKWIIPKSFLSKHCLWRDFLPLVCEPPSASKWWSLKHDVLTQPSKSWWDFPHPIWKIMVRLDDLTNLYQFVSKKTPKIFENSPPSHGPLAQGQVAQLVALEGTTNGDRIK